MNRETLHLLTAALLGGLALVPPGQAQETPRSTPLQRADRTFVAADRDRDGHIDTAEVRAAAMPAGVLANWDKDQDRALSRDEFLSYYRQLMVNAGREPGAELDREVKRAVAARKAREEQLARRKARDEQRSSEQVAAGDETVAEKYKRAQAALNERLARAGVSREVAGDQQGKLVERARGAGASSSGAAGGATRGAERAGASETVRERLARAQAALEDRARGAGASRGRFASANSDLVERARKAAGLKNSGTADPSAPDGTGSTLRGKLTLAEAALAERALKGDMTREQQQALKQQLEERARNAAGADAATSNAAKSVASKGVASESTASKSTAPAAAKPLPVSQLKQAGTRTATGTKAASRDQELAGVPAGERQKVSRALDALEKRALAGNWSRAQHDREKQALLDRARAAHAGQGASNAKPGETPEQRKQREARKRAAASGKSSGGAKVPGPSGSAAAPRDARPQQQQPATKPKQQPATKPKQKSATPAKKPAKAKGNQKAKQKGKARPADGPQKPDRGRGR